MKVHPIYFHNIHPSIFIFIWKFIFDQIMLIHPSNFMDHSFDLVRFLSSKSSITIPIRETKNPRFFNIYIALKLQINNIPKAKVASLKLETATNKKIKFGELQTSRFKAFSCASNWHIINSMSDFVWLVRPNTNVITMEYSLHLGLPQLHIGLGWYVICNANNRLDHVSIQLCDIYFRITNSKSNLAQPLHKSNWMR